MDPDGTFSSKGQTAPSLSVDHKVQHKGIACCKLIYLILYEFAIHIYKHTHTHNCCNYLHIVLSKALENTQVQRNRVSVSKDACSKVERSGLIKLPANGDMVLQSM